MNNEKIISIYNPKHPEYQPEPIVKVGHDSQQELYGGPAVFNDDGQNQRSVGRVDSNGNYIRCTPKATMKKNSEARQRVKFLRNPNQGENYDNIKSSNLNETYFSEYGFTELKEAYKYRNEDNEIVVNPRWGRFTKPVKGQIIYKLDPVDCNNNVVDPTI